MPKAVHGIVESQGTGDPALTLQERPPENEHREEQEQGQHFSSMSIVCSWKAHVGASEDGCHCELGATTKDFL